jgi:hypothetical protein
MHNIQDIKSICNQNILYLTCSVKLGVQNINFKVVNQHKNDTCMGGISFHFTKWSPQYF